MSIEKIKLDSKEFIVQKPESIAICFEFVIAWSTSESPVINARLCAGAIGIYLDKHAFLPKYKPLKESPTIYGYKCLERLLNLKIAGSIVYEVGSKLLTDMASSLPTDQGVEEKQDFFPSTNSEDTNY